MDKEITTEIVALLERLREIEPSSNDIVARCERAIEAMRSGPYHLVLRHGTEPAKVDFTQPLHQRDVIYWNSEVGFIEAQTAQPSRPEWRQSPGDFYGVPTMSAAEMLVKAADSAGPDGMPDTRLKPGEF